MAFFKKKKKSTFESAVVPEHVAIIPDGNRRWARQRNLPVKEGHRRGAECFKKTVKNCGVMGIKYVTFYAFSTENWKREKSEVDTLMNMLISFLRNFEQELGNDRDKIRIKVIGNRKGLSAELIEEIERVEKATEKNSEIIVNIAINYGSRDELTEGIRHLADRVSKGEISANDIDETVISESLFTKNTPDPDLLIRTSGELRISNFLLWQIAYTEFYFADVLWPDFDKRELEKAVDAFRNRKRRFGAS
jgi:undecaprenyl diphosphate synthase